MCVCVFVRSMCAHVVLEAYIWWSWSACTHACDCVCVCVWVGGWVGGCMCVSCVHVSHTQDSVSVFLVVVAYAFVRVCLCERTC